MHIFRETGEAPPRAGIPTSFLRSLVPLVLALTLANPVGGQNLTDIIEIHGFGGWAYGETDGNRYVVGNEDGEYENAEFSLNITSTPYDELKIVGQLHFEQEIGGDVDVDLDYIFAEWFFSDAAKLRIGRVKLPFGNYGEIFAVGTARPFYFLPQGIYGRNGTTARAYNGVGLSGSSFRPSGWGVQYDVYGGQIDGEIDTNLTRSRFELNQMIGARVNVHAPIDGLRFGVSAYNGEFFLDFNNTAVSDQTVLGTHLEYLDSKWSVRAEAIDMEIDDQIEVSGYYVEVGYRITSHWQLAARYEDWEGEPQFVFVPGTFEHSDAAFGINYWFKPSFVLRAELHQVEGNRMALPETLAGPLDDETELILFGGQFSF